MIMMLATDCTPPPEGWFRPDDVVAGLIIGATVVVWVVLLGLNRRSRRGRGRR